MKEKDFKEENLKEDSKKEEKKVARVVIVNHKKRCIRERNTSAGNKGSFMKGCPSPKRKKSIWDVYLGK